MKNWLLGCVVLLALTSPNIHADDPLPSWNKGEARDAIIAFVRRVSTEGSEDYVAPAARIATFDNDGTLWAEQPMYFQAIFAFDQVRAMAAEHPEWKRQEPFASVLKGDAAAALAGGTHSLLELVVASHSGVSVEAFGDTVTAWSAPSRHNTTS